MVDQTRDTSIMLPFDGGLASTRRRVLLTSLLAALPLGLSAGSAEAINPSETQVTLPDQISWTAWTAGPPHSAEMATLFGELDKPGEYVVLMKWYPGYMSAPHTYATDRLCLVLSGTWWVNSRKILACPWHPGFPASAIRSVNGPSSTLPR